MTAPTPAELRELAGRAQALAAEVAALQVRLRAAEDEPTRRVGFRLDDAAAAISEAAHDVVNTAVDLARIRGRGDCPCDWGVCPEHGNTLRSSAGLCWCTAANCGRSWGYDRGGLPCTEPAAFDVRDLDDRGGPMCAGHAHDARTRLIGAKVTAL